MATKTNNKEGGKNQTATITKIEGLRHALAELGQDATTDSLQAYLKKHFGLEMSKDHIYVSKGYIRKQDAKKAAQPEAKVETAPKLAAEPAPQSSTSTANETAQPIPQPTKPSLVAGITKKEGVRRALKELGKDATPTAIQPFLQERFGIEMSREAITKSKSNLLRKKATKKKAKAEPKKEEAQPRPLVQTAAASSSSATSKKANGTGAVLLEDIVLIKELIGRIGPDGLRTLIAVFGK